MRARVFSLALAILFFALLPGRAAAQSQNCAPPAAGDWFVNETSVCSSETIVLNGSLLINGSGNLTLEDSTLQFNSSFDGQFGVEVNGSLYVIRSLIQNSSESSKAYAFVSNVGAKLVIRDAFVYGCGFDSQDNKKRGVYIKSAGSNVTNTTFSNNYIALLVRSDDNNVSGNRITSGYDGILVEGAGCRITGNNVTGNARNGVHLSGGANAFLADNLVNASGQYDIFMLSAANATMANTNYTTLVRRWRLDMVVADSGGGVSGADVAVKNSLNATVFSGATNASGGIAQQIIDERLENASGIFTFSPYAVNVTKAGYYGNYTVFNLTGDLLLAIVITPVPQEQAAFNLTIESPKNDTYMKYNLTSGGTLLISGASEKNMTWCNYSFGGAWAALSQASPTRFQAYVNVSAMDGPYELVIYCNSYENVTNSSRVAFTVRPSYECSGDSHCAADKRCASNKCVGIECACGYASNHACVSYECCADSSCSVNETCDVDAHSCEPVLCDCPEKIANHKCNLVPGYCCKDMLCAENETCDLIRHECIERLLSFVMPEKLAFGQNVTIRVVDQNGDPVPVVKIDVKYTSADPPITETYYTDSSGEVQVQVNHAGNVEFVARKGGYFLGHSSGEVPEPFDFIFLIEVVVLIVSCAGIAFTAFRLLRHRGGGGFSLGGGPLKLEKTVSAPHVMLKIKNKTKKTLEGITVRDAVPRGAFIRSNLMPKIEQWNSGTDVLTWEILRLAPKEEVDIEYESRSTFKGFSVKHKEKEYRG